MNNHTRIRRAVGLATVVVATVALAIAGSAAAAGGDHTQTITENFHGTQTSADVNPCTGNAVSINETTNMVFHVTYFPASDEEWFTFTEEDKVTAVDQGTGVVYTGHATTWGNQNVNRQNANWTTTSSLRVTGSDGSSITSHDVAHVTMLPDGSVSVSFDKPRLTCG